MTYHLASDQAYEFYDNDFEAWYNLRVTGIKTYAMKLQKKIADA